MWRVEIFQPQVFFGALVLHLRMGTFVDLADGDFCRFGGLLLNYGRMVLFHFLYCFYYHLYSLFIYFKKRPTILHIGISAIRASLAMGHKSKMCTGKGGHCSCNL